MNFANVKGITIPEGVVKALSVGEKQVWSAVTVDKYSWEAVFASMDAGTYATDYAIGDCIPLDLGSEGVINMQIAGFDAEDLADGSGKAKITWIAKELLATDKTMGSGNWETCSMRSYLKNTIKPLIADTVRNRICEISKLRTNHQSGTEATFVDDVWLPTYDDINPALNTRLYEVLYPTAESVIKTKAGQTSPAFWWTCQQQGSTWWAISNVGIGRNFSEDTAGVSVCLGFCTN